MPCSAACFTSSGRLRRYSKPPCTLGCSVFTRPPSISGQPVNSETSFTATPDSRNNFAVPPVERISIFSAASRFANSRTPVLSNTLISARCTAMKDPPRTEAIQCKRNRNFREAADCGNFKRGNRYGSRVASLGFDQRFELYLVVDGFNHVLDLAAIFLFLRVLGFLAHKLFESFVREPRNILSNQLFRFHEGVKQFIDLFFFAFRLRAGHPEVCLIGNHRGVTGISFSKPLRAFRFNRFGRRTEVPLHGSFFFLLALLAENIAILGVGLREVVVAESLAILHIPGAFPVLLNDQFDAPLNLSGRTLTPSAKELIVLNLQLPDIAFELSEFFVDGGHEGSFSFSIVGAGDGCVNHSRAPGD